MQRNNDRKVLPVKEMKNTLLFIISKLATQTVSYRRTKVGYHAGNSSDES